MTKRRKATSLVTLAVTLLPLAISAYEFYETIKKRHGKKGSAAKIIRNLIIYDVFRAVQKKYLHNKLRRR